MKKTKKIVALVCVISMLVSSVTGCGTKKKTLDNDKTTQETSITSENKTTSRTSTTNKTESEDAIKPTVSEEKNAYAPVAGGKIPKGCMYYIGSKNTLLRAGMEFPENIEHGDVYITPEYVYTFPPITVGAHGIDACNVNPIDKTQEKYGKPLDNMYGIPVEGLKGITIDETVKVTKPVVPEDLLLQDEKVDYSPAAGKKIPVGCLYYIGDENTLLVAGTEFPENVTHGDVYITPEYVYTFPPMLVGKHGIDACKMSIISKTQEKHSIPLDNLYGIPVE